jgi:hypothetical protein
MRTAPATSAGSPQRPIGVRATMAAERCASAMAGAVSGVSIHPGAMALTRMPCAAHATASDFVSCAMPPFDAA